MPYVQITPTAFLIISCISFFFFNSETKLQQGINFHWLCSSVSFIYFSVLSTQQDSDRLVIKVTEDPGMNQMCIDENNIHQKCQLTEPRWLPLKHFRLVLLLAPETDLVLLTALVRKPGAV